MRLLRGEGQFLVFSSYELLHMRYMLEQEGVEARTLQGHPTTVDRTIRDFNAGRVKVLLLNTQNYGAGLNLQSTTDLVLVHRLPDALRQQVVGRAQRPGREGRLRVHSLVHDGERESVAHP